MRQKNENHKTCNKTQQFYNVPRWRGVRRTGWMAREDNLQQNTTIQHSFTLKTLFTINYPIKQLPVFLPHG